MRESSRLALAIVVAAIIITVPATVVVLYDSHPAPAQTITRPGSTVVRTVTAISTVTSFYTVTSTGSATSTTGSSVPPIYEEGQVVPIAVNFSGPTPQSSFTPQVVRLVVGINNSVSFENVGRGFVGVETTDWPSNGTGFESDILGEGASWSTDILVPGQYQVNDYLHPVMGGLSILVAGLPGISSSTNASETVTMRGPSVCSDDCSGGETFDVQLLTNGAAPMSATLYLNGTDVGGISYATTQPSYPFDLNLSGSSISVTKGDTFFVEMLVRFADGNVAVTTAILTAG